MLGALERAWAMGVRSETAGVCSCFGEEHPLAVCGAPSKRELPASDSRAFRVPLGRA